MEDLIVYEKIELNKPYLVMGFYGWPNAGEVATNTLLYLIKNLPAKIYAEINPEDFYILTTSEYARPQGAIEKGTLVAFDPPKSVLYYWKNERGNDILLLLGREPDIRWKRYSDTILDFLSRFGLKRVFTIGGEYALVPHTRDPRISVVVNNERLKEELEGLDIDFADYTGPTCIHTYLLLACKIRGIDCISLWGDAPNYIQMSNPKVSYFVLKRLIKLLGIELSLEDIRKEGENFEQQISKAIAQKPEAQEFLRKLEEAYDESRKANSTDKSEIEELIKGVEDFLRQDGQERQE
ncbi:MAG: PAC2 family protein [bacterium]|nr:PAC2 family protein [bacterium]